MSDITNEGREAMPLTMDQRSVKYYDGLADKSQSYRGDIETAYVVGCIEQERIELRKRLGDIHELAEMKEIRNRMLKEISDLQAEVERLKAEIDGYKKAYHELTDDLEGINDEIELARSWMKVHEGENSEYLRLKDRNAKMEEALSELVHLHICEQEGLQSGRPTPAQWLAAVDKASGILNPETK